MFEHPAAVEKAVRELAQALAAGRMRLACAESCTGGLVAAACTSLAGSSEWFDRGFVTYSNEAKSEMLGVPVELITTHGAVSEVVVKSMADGALARSRAQVALAISGVAGPGGGTAAKPVGLVCFAWSLGTGASALQGVAAPQVHAASRHVSGNRAQVREAAVLFAVQTMARMVQHPAQAAAVLKACSEPSR